MTAASSFFLAYAAIFALAVGFYPALSLGPRVRLAALWLFAAGIAMMPLLVPADAPSVRFMVAILAVCFVLKLIDLHLGALRGLRVGFRPFLAFLCNLLQGVQRRTGCERQPSGRENARDFLVGLVGMVLALGLLKWAGRVDWSARSFLLEHTVRASAFFIAVLFSWRLLAALMHVAGVYTVNPNKSPFLARTPADFWRRYNRWMGQFLHEDVFKPLGGRRHPVRATLLVFAVSGLLHEYCFGVAIGRVQGYQTAFFLLQGVAVALTLRVKPAGLAALAWGSGTLVFNLLSSLFFFASMQGLGPLYSAGLPAWFPAW